MTLDVALANRLKDLATTQKQEALEYLQQLIDLETSGDGGSTSVDVPVVATAKGSYVLEYVRCGKPNCRCNRGIKHGPYYFLHRKVEGRTVKKYIGKQLK